MGCNCNKKVNSTVAKAAPASVSTPKVGNGAACQEKYDELAQLDKKVISLYKRFKWSQMGYKYAEMQKVIRGWIVNLKTECPDEDELKSFKDYINKEYSRYF